MAGIQWQRNIKCVDHPLGVRDENGDTLSFIVGYQDEFVTGQVDLRPNAMNFQTFLPTF